MRKVFLSMTMTFDGFFAGRTVSWTGCHRHQIRNSTMTLLLSFKALIGVLLAIRQLPG